MFVYLEVLRIPTNQSPSPAPHEQGGRARAPEQAVPRRNERNFRSRRAWRWAALVLVLDRLMPWKQTHAGGSGGHG